MTQKTTAKKQAHAQPIRIVVVDDNAIFLQTLVRYLSWDTQLVVVGSASGGKQGLELAKQLQPDIMLVDLQMQDMSGLDLFPLLRSGVPNTLIVAMTLYGEKMFQEAALKQGAHAFLAKDKMVQELLPLIHTLYATGRPNKPLLDSQQETDMTKTSDKHAQETQDAVEQLDLANKVLERAKENLEHAQNVIQDTQEALAKQNDSDPEKK